MNLNLTMFLSIVVFLVGLYFYARGTDYSEGFSTTRCPNLLIQKGAKFYLYNSKVAEVPGVNPIEFDNLEDYTEFLAWQKSQGIKCPVLYLQNSFDAQGNQVYKARPSISNPQAGLPPSTAAPIGIASQTQPMPEIQTQPLPPNPTMLVDATRNDPPFNNNSYPGYDETSYYVGTTTPLDAMDAAKEKANVSDNPMDPNWGGAAYTQSLVDKGYYKNDNVSIYVS
jgi:hypothetical protein